MAMQPDLNGDVKVLLQVREAAARLGVGRTTVFELIKEGKIASVLIGRSRRIPVGEVEAYVARLVAEQCGRQHGEAVA